MHLEMHFLYHGKPIGTIGSRHQPLALGKKGDRPLLARFFLLLDYARCLRPVPVTARWLLATMIIMIIMILLAMLPYVTYLWFFCRSWLPDADIRSIKSSSGPSATT
jgi:hypothetical protein